MKVVLFMAQSLNGIIARENNNEDFLSDDNWEIFKRLAEKSGIFIVGRKTYEVVSIWNNNFNNIKAKKIIVSKQKLNLTKDYYVVGSPRSAVLLAKELGIKEVILTGGSIINSSFAKENLIDEVVLNIEPAIIGKGIKLFSEDDFEYKLELIDVKKVASDIVQLRYKIRK
jgi:dihydrofolate reductase